MLRLDLESGPKFVIKRRKPVENQNRLHGKRKGPETFRLRRVLRTSERCPNSKAESAQWFSENTILLIVDQTPSLNVQSLHTFDFFLSVTNCVLFGGRNSDGNVICVRNVCEKRVRQ